MSAPNTARIWTIGHSNRTLEEFTGLLKENSITQVLDVRKLAGSDKFPHFNSDALAEPLDAIGIKLWKLEPLDGRRTVSKEIPFETNAWWENRSFHNYADHALSPEFTEALAELRDAASSQHTAVMCSEAVWWRCHRRIISDHLIAHQLQVLHIMGPDKTVDAQLSAGAVIDESAMVRYPAQT